MLAELFSAGREDGREDGKCVYLRMENTHCIGSGGPGQGYAAREGGNKMDM